MKRLTITYDDDVELDISVIFPLVKTLHLETLDTGASDSAEHAPTQSNGATKSKEKVSNGTHKKWYHPNYTVVQAIMKQYTIEGEFSLATAIKWVKELGFAEGSASGALYLLTYHEYVARLSQDRWKFKKTMPMDKKVTLAKPPKKRQG